MSRNISVVITSFNQKAYLGEAIKSAINQTMTPFEIIIVDDCSSDGSQKIIKEFEQAYPKLIRAFYNERNLGRPKNKNFAQKLVKGDFITWLDGDDRFLPAKLETEYMNLMKHQQVKIIYSNFYHIDRNGQRIGLWAHNGMLPSGNLFKEVFGLKRPLCFFRSELTYYDCMKKSNNFYDPFLEMYGDWDLRIRLTKYYKALYNPKPSAEYRQHPLGISKSSVSKHIHWIKTVYRKNRNLLDNIPVSDKIFVKNGIKSYFALLCFNAAQKKIKRENNKDALKYWLQHIRYRPKSILNIRFTARILLSKQTKTRLKLAYKKINKKYL